MPASRPAALDRLWLSTSPRRATRKKACSLHAQTRPCSRTVYDDIRFPCVNEYSQVWSCSYILAVQSGRRERGGFMLPAFAMASHTHSITSQRLLSGEIFAPQSHRSFANGHIFLFRICTEASCQFRTQTALVGCGAPLAGSGVASLLLLPVTVLWRPHRRPLVGEKVNMVSIRQRAYDGCHRLVQAIWLLS